MSPLYRDKRTILISGSGLAKEVLEELSICHPFVKQIDIVFPSHSELSKNLLSFQTTYSSGSFTLTAILDATYHITDPYALRSEFSAISIGSNDTDDAWCLDHLGLLTLLLTKESYQRLGLVGEKDAKSLHERYVVVIDTLERQSKMYSRARNSLVEWDKYRESSGIGLWKVLYRGSPVLQAGSQHTSERLERHEENTIIPHFKLRSPGALEGDDTTDLQDEVSDYFEWIGLACLGSERLKANDKPNPYIAVYDAPSPHEVGTLTHFSIRGFLTPSYIAQVGNACINALGSQTNEISKPAFLAVTAHMYSNAPVTFIHPRVFAETQKTEARKKPQSNQTFCWSLLVVPEENGSMNWAKATVSSS